MATTKNITMKQFNGTDYDTLYPKTIGAQIAGAVPIASGGTNGTTAPSGVNNLVAGLSQITPASNDLFPFRDISGNTGGSVTLANLVTALGNSGAITSSNLASQASALGFTKIQTGSYDGTGTSGVNNPCSLTFNFAPKLFIFTMSWNYRNDGTHSNLESSPICFGALIRDQCELLVDCTAVTTDYKPCGPGYGTINIKKSSDGKTLIWYSLVSDTDNGKYQMNYNLSKYWWVALG